MQVSRVADDFGVQVNSCFQFDVGALFRYAAWAYRNISISRWLLVMALIFATVVGLFPALLRPIGPSKSLRWKPSARITDYTRKMDREKDTPV
jgi:hypothetical protein